jgi:hypothetical protein
MKSFITTAILVLGFSCWLPTAHAVEADLVISGVIANQMGQASKDLLELAKDKNVVTITIDSPGGSVYAGWEFMSAMQQAKAGGTRLDCYVTGMAASMAFQIFNYCDRRYALPYSTLLWHPVRMSLRGGLTPNDAKDVYLVLRDLEIELLAQLRETFRVNSKYFWFHYRIETLHLARSLSKHSGSFFKLTRLAPKVNNNTKIPEARGMFFRKMDVQYIHPRALERYNIRTGVK